MRLLYLDWPHLPIRLERARRALPDTLVVLGGQPWDHGVVLDASPAATRLGVHRGQPLGSAHNLVPEAIFLPADRGAYEAAFEAALEALAPFTPAVEGQSDPDGPTFGQVFLGIEGLERLWGAEHDLARRVITTLEPLLPGPPRVGIGNTRFGAQVAAVVGARRARRRGREGAPPRDLPVESIPRGDAVVEARYLAPLPVRLLPADRDVQDRLRLFGLARIGDVAALPRSAVVARFGRVGGEMHDLANGLDGRALQPRRPVERLSLEAELDPPAETLEPLRFVLHHLATVLCEQLAARGAGAAHASLLVELEAGDPLRVEQSLPEPAAAPELLERLLLARLEAAPPGAPVERLHLELAGAAPAGGRQLGLFSPQLARAARLDWQLAGLSIRFGADRILQAQLLDPEALLAEERFAWRAVASTPLSGSPEP